MARQLVWDRFYRNDAALGPSKTSQFFAISSAAFGETFTRVRFRATFTADPQFPLGSLATEVGFGIYETDDSLAGPFLDWLVDRNDDRWVWWESVVFDPPGAAFDSAGAVDFTWSNTASASAERDVRAQRKANDPGSVLIFTWQINSAFHPQLQAWSSVTASTGILAAP